VRPSLEGVPAKLLPDVTAQLSTSIPLTISAPHIADDSYWKRAVADRPAWKCTQISDHGQTWKQTYLEKYIREVIETFDPAKDGLEKLRATLVAAEEGVHRLTITQLLSHLDLHLVFASLPNLSALELTYGVHAIGMRYERALFGMKVSDATSLAGCLRSTEMLTTLSLPCNLLDDDLLRMLMTGLIHNSTVTKLDVSHNKITNHGTRLLAKLLGSRSVLTSLNLCDNQVHAEGGRYLGRALRRNDSLTELNLRLNRLGDEGGRMLLDGLRENAALQSLAVSTNSLGAESARALAYSLSHGGGAGLTSLDLSGNQLTEADAALLRDALAAAPAGQITGFDLRQNLAPREAECLADIDRIVRRNELERRGGK
jgi:hypothetical protein